MLLWYNVFWNGGKKLMKVCCRGDMEECFYLWNGVVCELMCIYLENKMF